MKHKKAIWLLYPAKYPFCEVYWCPECGEYLKVREIGSNKEYHIEGR